MALIRFQFRIESFRLHPAIKTVCAIFEDSVTKILHIAFALTVSAVLTSCAPPQRPDWITAASVDQLRSLGIDPDRDLSDQGNYHWQWISRGVMVVGNYHCPAGSFIAISRTITVVGAPRLAACRSPTGAEASLLKLYADGSAEPLGSP